MCPDVETPRLTLRAHRQEDFEPLAAMWADPDIARHISGKPATTQESWFRLLRYRGLWLVLGYGYWCVREKQSGRYIGDVGFADFKRGIEPSISGVPEAGWVIASWAHGRGFASEAVAAMLAWLDQKARFEKTVCLLAAGNAPSVRVAEKNGFVASATVGPDDEDTGLRIRLRPVNHMVR